MIFRTSDASICNGNINMIQTLSKHQLFTLNFMFKLSHVSVAVANIGSLNSLINTFTIK